jgi:hypothetical protein
MMGSLDPALVAAWVVRSCEAQGVPVFVSDPNVLSRVRALMGAGEPAAGPRRGVRRLAAPTAPTPG